MKEVAYFEHGLQLESKSSEKLEMNVTIMQPALTIAGNVARRENIARLIILMRQEAGAAFYREASM